VPGTETNQRVGSLLQTPKHGGAIARVPGWFPERGFCMRSQGQLRFIRISPRLQITVAGVVAGVHLAWLLATLAMIAFQVAASKDRLALLEREAKVATAESRVSAYRKDVDQVATDLQKRQDFIEQAVRSQLGDLPEQAQDANGTVSDSSGETADTVAKISMVLPGAANLARIEQRQLAFAERLTLLADRRAAAAETAIRRLGLNPRLMLAKINDSSAMGGPLLGSSASLDPRFQRLGLSLVRMEALENGLSSVPHNLPASLQYISSGFGYRSDPFTGAAAMHAGLDSRGPVGAPIYAAARGVVRFAGVKSGYGNCIEIDHGNGLMTRYAHMSGFRARIGQAVAAGDVIGAIGNTGRSTGSHLHFEVRINDQAVNPRPFLEANRNVFEETRGGGAAADR